MDQKQPASPDSESLESSSNDNSLEGTSTEVVTSENSKAKPKGIVGKVKGLLGHLNIYMLLFILMVVIAVVIVFVAMQISKKDAAKSNATTQSLSEDALKSLEGSDAKVGDAKQTLNVESNAIFSGKVLIREGLEVAGGIKIGGALSLPGLTVSGTSSFDQIQANSLAINGNATIAGLLSIQKGLTVSGPATFSSPISAPQITIDRLQINQDIQFSRHIDAGGSTPGVSGGSALGSGGNATISGTDTAGTVTLNIGTGAPSGVLANITFSSKFSGIPHVVISPIGSGAAALNWYITSRSTTGFSIACTGAPSPGSFSFDFIAVD